MDLIISNSCVKTEDRGAMPLGGFDFSCTLVSSRTSTQPLYKKKGEKIQSRFLLEKCFLDIPLAKRGSPRSQGAFVGV